MSISNIRLRLHTLLFLSCLAIAIVAPSVPAHAACDPLPSDKGQSTGTVGLNSAGQYTLWVRMWAPSSGSDSVFAQVDTQCPVVVGDAQPGNDFRWVSFKDGVTSQPIRYDLTTGSHKIVLAGREVGAGVDRVLLALDPACIPVGFGDNCLTSTDKQEEAKATEDKTSASMTSVAKAAMTPHRPNWWLIGGSAAVLLATFGFMVWKYLSFMKEQTIGHQQSDIIVGSGLHPKSGIARKVQYFIRHHKVESIISIIVIITAIIIGVVAATNGSPAFEAEAGTFSGGAKVVDNSQASNGKFIVFNNNPAASGGTGGGSHASGSGSGTTGGGSNGSSGSSGSTSSGGSSSGGTTSCALPKYPTPNCTGVPAGITLQTVGSNNPPDNDAYIITTPGTVIEGKHIMAHLIIRANNVVVKNSQIEGNVDNEESTSGGNIIYPYTISDTTVTAPSCQTAPGLASGSYTATRVKVLNHDDGFRVSTPGNVTITDSYAKMCWNPPSLAPPDGSHSGGLQATCGDGTCFNTVFSHNTIDNSQPNANSGITMQSCAGLNQGCGTDNPISGLTASDNLIFGGGYTVIFWWTTGPNYNVYNNRVVNNSWVYGPVDTKSTCAHQNWLGNTLVTVDGYTAGQEYDWQHGSYNVTSTVGAQNCVN